MANFDIIAPFLSFDKGDVFTVHNELGDGWLWVTSQRTREDGLVFEELVEDLVSIFTYFIGTSFLTGIYM